MGGDSRRFEDDSSNAVTPEMGTSTLAEKALEADEKGLGRQEERNEAHKDPYEVAWENGEQDPLNPQSFSKSRKWLIVLITAVGSLTITCVSSIYTTTFAQMEAEFHNARIISSLGLSTFVLGLGMGPMVLSPLSELYGRRPIYLVAWSMHLVWLVPQAVARNVGTVVATRFLDGLAGSAWLAVSGGTVRDLFSLRELQLPMAVFSVAPFVGPSVGPLVGGFINYHVDWRWTYWVMLIWGGVLGLAVLFFVPETHHPVLLRNKARALRSTTGDERWTAPMERSQQSAARTVLASLKRPLLLLVLEPMILSLAVYSALLLGILYLFFEAFPLVFGTVYGFNGWQVGLTFVGIGVGMVLGTATDPLWQRVRARLVAGLGGASEPEFRLPPAILGGAVVPVGLFIFAWTTYPSVHWIVPIIGSAIFGIGNVLVFTGIFTFLVDAYPVYAASVLGGNTFGRSLAAAAFPLFGVKMYERLGFQWASSLLALLTLGMMPLPVLFFKYGKTLRGKSRFAKD